ncbi:small nucleolar ribonucleoprotein complex subunit [Purpureocillium lilacinum]|uniref:Small nucleolar ribonucleoprotein complex subunit n=1 Tax=Purpureocillium lilacinum TaxID=33203 RepID=A0A179HM32_PURLI|nr:small nucleolar ribonucleoprotein complex subunit [Purpureocillium lilacinum]OAQ90922.1 small nucleolar ribonucleoprotein complex subunit [Purpureocillium lilacinum]
MAAEKDQWVSDQEQSDSDMSSDLSSDDDIAINTTSNAAMFDKDSDEEELERLVLGNKASFRENLFKDGGDLYGDGADDQDVELADADTAGMEDVEDADLFMIDTGAPGAGSALSKPTPASKKTEQGDVPAWEDSDDERLAISLAKATRLRKLRTTEAEDVISGTEYSRRLRQQFLRLNPAPAWAQQSDGRPTKRRRRSSAASGSSSDSSGSDDEDASAPPLDKFLRDVNQLAGLGGGSKKRPLRPEVIDMQRTREIPDKHKMPVECLSFHPEYPVLLSASTASILYLHHIAPDAQPPNPQLTSVQVKQVDVRRAEFLYPQGDKIFFAGRRRYFHHWDLPSGVVQKTSRVAGHQEEHKSMERFKLSPCGRYMGIVASSRKGGGIINVISVATAQWIAAARLQSRHGIADFAWWSTGDGMTILGKDGQVGEYSMESRSFLGVWQDDGSVGAIVIALGGHRGPEALGDDRWVAVGSNTGITNIYDRNELIVPNTSSSDTNDGDGGDDRITIKERPTPTRTFEQLVTPITVLTFSPDGQLLAFGSRQTKDALRLVHLPSCTVYRNWPTAQTPLGRITAVAFGRDSGLLAVGNDAGKIRLWHIRS